MTVQITRPAEPFRYEDLEGIPDDSFRREIIGGSLIVTPAPSGRHQRVALNLAVVLRAAEIPASVVLVAPYDWRLPDGGSVQPDVIVVPRESFDPDGPFPASARPLLVVEILSPSDPQQDLAVKRALYEHLGVPAYWIIDPVRPSLLALRLTDNAYAVEAELRGEAELVTDWPFPVRCRPSQLVL